MKVLVIGANGFVGKGVSEALRPNYDVVTADRNNADGLQVDLENPDSIAAILQQARPDAVVNCAGIVQNDETAAKNVVFTRNLLEQIVASSLPIKGIIVMGSAAEYGTVDSLPVNEDAPRRATNPYGLSKIEEVDTVLRFREEHGLPVVVARLFNPIGAGMHERMLIPGVLRQIDACRNGSERIEVGRLDAMRDFIDVSDVGGAIGALLSKKPQHAVYNVGSGTSTSIREFVETMLAESDLPKQPELVEKSDTPEPQIASQADISRIQDEFGWHPEKTVAQTISEVIHDSK